MAASKMSSKPAETPTAANNRRSSSTTQMSTAGGGHRRTSRIKLCYHLAVSYALYLFLAPTLAALALHHLSRGHTAADLIASARTTLTAAANNNNLPFAVVAAAAAAVLATAYLLRRPRAVYLLDFACYKPGAEHAVTREAFMKIVAGFGTFTDENLAFQRKIIERSGLGQSTYLPKALLTSPPTPSMAAARAEAEAVMFGAVDQVLAKTGVRAADIGIVVVNSGLFSPTPSLSAMVVHRYKLRGDVASYNLGGMGCSASLVAVDLARQLLQVRAHRSTCALVVSLEVIAANAYFGNDRSMLVSNCLFRMGGAAVVLTNRSSDGRRRAKYRLLHTVRTHRAGADDGGRAYRCVYQEEDGAGLAGVTLSKDVMAVAGDALRDNITALGPLVLPMSEQLLFLASLVARRVFRRRWKPYVPDFKTAFEHFCVHAGGRAVLDTVERSLELSPWHMEPSRMTLYRWGNTSSSTTWYELAYAEAQGRVRRGHRVWQIGFGSGFKCASGVWVALRDVDPAAEKDAGGNPWVDEIHNFPVEVPKVERVVVDDDVAMAS